MRSGGLEPRLFVGLSLRVHRASCLRKCFRILSECTALRGTGDAQRVELNTDTRAPQNSVTSSKKHTTVTARKVWDDCNPIREKFNQTAMRARLD